MVHAAALALSSLGVCAAIAFETLYITKSKGLSVKEGQPQARSDASPIYGITIPAGYRDWRLISTAHLAGGTSSSCAPNWATIS